MKVVIRADASLTIGSGHIMRCLTLADALRQHGADVLFICREHPGHLIGLIESKGYSVVCLQFPTIECETTLDDVAHAAWLGVSWLRDSVDTIDAIKETQPEWLIVDHYAIDHRWERKLLPHVGKIMVIDDLADRAHECSLLLDQNLYENMESRYIGLVPDHCVRLLGPRHALLRPEFMKAAKNVRKRDGSVNRILIFFGGSDPGNETTKALEAISLLRRPDIAVDVVVGGANPCREEVKTLCVLAPNTTYHCQVGNMAELMMAADLAIGAGGSTTWERCLVGLPSITMMIAENQALTTEMVAKSGASKLLGYSTNVSTEQLANSIQWAINNSLRLKEMSDKAARIMESTIFTGISPLLAAILGEENAHT